MTTPAFPDGSSRPDAHGGAYEEDERPAVDDTDVGADDIDPPLSVPFDVPEADLVDQRRRATVDDEAWNHE